MARCMPIACRDKINCIFWPRTNATTLGLDKQRICSAGLSSSAHLAVFLGVLQSMLPGGNAKLLSTETSRVSCGLDFYGPVDLGRTPLTGEMGD